MAQSTRDLDASQRRRRVAGPPRLGAGDASASDAHVDPRTRAPIALAVMFAAVAATAGRLPPYVSEAVLLVLVIGAARVDMPVPRNPAALLGLFVVALAGVQVLVEVIHGGRPGPGMRTSLVAIYTLSFAYLVHALLRRWESRLDRRSILSRIERAVLLVTPYVILTMAALAAQKVVVGDGAWDLRSPLRSIVSTAGIDTAAPLAFSFTVLVAAPAGSPVARNRRLLLAVWAFPAVAFAFEGRAVALGLVAAGLVVHATPARLARGAYLAAVVLIVLWGSGLSLGVGSREISYDAAVALGASLVESDEATGDGDLVATREWRSAWWSAIWDDITDEPLVWRGLGWDVNVGEHYDVTVYDPRTGEPRHSFFPHNLFLSLTAHGGVLLATAFLSIPILTLLARHPGNPGPGSLLARAARSAVVAALVTSMFGVTLEASIVASTFWALIGFLWWRGSAPFALTSPRRPA